MIESPKRPGLGPDSSPLVRAEMIAEPVYRDCMASAGVGRAVELVKKLVRIDYSLEFETQLGMTGQAKWTGDRWRITEARWNTLDHPTLVITNTDEFESWERR